MDVSCLARTDCLQGYLIWSSDLTSPFWFPPQSMFYLSTFDGELPLTFNTSQVVDMGYMFYGTDFNGDLSWWDVSKVTDASYMVS